MYKPQWGDMLVEFSRIKRKKPQRGGTQVTSTAPLGLQILENKRRLTRYLTK